MMIAYLFGVVLIGCFSLLLGMIFNNIDFAVSGIFIAFIWPLFVSLLLILSTTELFKIYREIKKIEKETSYEK